MFLACGRDRVVRPAAAAVLEPIDDRLQLRPNSQQPSLSQIVSNDGGSIIMFEYFQPGEFWHGPVRDLQ